MKKILCLLLALIMPLILFSGCNKVPNSKDFTSEDNDRFVFVKEYTYGDNDSFSIIVDKETRVMYLYKCILSGQSSRAGLTVMLNPDGTPMLWEGELEGESK